MWCDVKEIVKKNQQRIITYPQLCGVCFGFQTHCTLYVQHQVAEKHKLVTSEHYKAF